MNLTCKANEDASGHPDSLNETGITVLVTVCCIIIIIIIFFILLHKSNHRYVSWGCGNGHIAKDTIIKIRYNIITLKIKQCDISISHHYLSRYIKQLYNSSHEWLFLILVIVIMNCGDKSIKLPKLNRQIKNMCCYLS